MAATLGKFNSPHQQVGVLVGATYQSTTPTLTAYDINGKVVATASGSAVAGQAGVQLNAVSTSAVPNIFFFVIQGTENGAMLWIKNLTFDSVVSATPDFLLYNVAVTVGKGYSVIQGSNLLRLGGSNGLINL